MVLSGTYLITQVGLNDAGVNLDLSIEDAGKVANGPTGAGNAKEGPVEYSDLPPIGNREPPYEVGGEGGITLFSIFFVVAGSAKKSWYAKSGIFLTISSRGTYSWLGGK